MSGGNAGGKCPRCLCMLATGDICVYCHLHPFRASDDHTDNSNSESRKGKIHEALNSSVIFFVYLLTFRSKSLRQFETRHEFASVTCPSSLPTCIVCSCVTKQKLLTYNLCAQQFDNTGTDTFMTCKAIDFL